MMRSTNTLAHLNRRNPSPNRGNGGALTVEHKLENAARFVTTGATRAGQLNRTISEFPHDGEKAAKHSAVRQVISQVNSLLESAKFNASDRRTRSVLNEIETVLRRNNRALHEIGVGFTRDGFMTLDDDKLREAVENGTTDNLFGENSRFLASFSRIAQNVSANPTRHISPQAANHPHFRNVLDHVRNATEQAAQLSQLQNQHQTFSGAAEVNQMIAALLNGSFFS
jgi:hypothetical protein